jgi:hypothetical protein
VRVRTKRELLVGLGVIAILASIALANSAYQRGDLSVRMDKYRRQIESGRQKEGLDLLSWDLLRKTTGTVAKGPTFAKDLLGKDKQPVDIVGFMVPLEQFRNMTEFLLLPLPIECYFCQMPPMRDVMVVEMAEGKNTNVVKEPVLINGELTLNQGPGTRFFYSIKNAKMGPGKRDAKLTPKSISQQHMIPGHQPKEENLLPPMNLPKPAEKP